MLVDGAGPATCFHASRLISKESALSACAMDSLPLAARFPQCEAKALQCDAGVDMDDAGSAPTDASPGATIQDSSTPMLDGGVAPAEASQIESGTP
jgi:hypothetical protein